MKLVGWVRSKGLSILIKNIKGEWGFISANHGTLGVTARIRVIALAILHERNSLICC